MNFHEAPHTYVSEVHLNILDLERSLRFYQEIIGFKVLKKGDKKAVLTADGQTPLLTIEQLENITPKEPRKTGLYHFALLLPSRADLGDIIIHLAQNGVRLGSADHLVSEALYLSDPDGNGIEIYIDRDPSEWSWQNGQVAMSTDPLDAEAIVAESVGAWKGLPAETLMGHIHLHVASLQETEKFYEALGFEIVTLYPGALFMSTGKYHHHLGLNIWNGEGATPPTKNSVGLQSYTLQYPNESARDEAVAKIEQLGSQKNSENRTVVIEDPAGNRIIMSHS